MSGHACDFCPSLEAVWEYPARDFVLPVAETIHVASLGGWCACEKCYQLIQAHDTHRLKKRMAVQHGIDLSRDGVVSAFYSREIQEFFRNRTGPPRPIGGTQNANPAQEDTQCLK